MKKNKNCVVIAVLLMLSATTLVACDGEIKPDTPDNPTFTPVQTDIEPIVLKNQLPFSKVLRSTNRTYSPTKPMY
jgi:hypothetical protein